MVYVQQISIYEISKEYKKISRVLPFREQRLGLSELLKMNLTPEKIFNKFWQEIEKQKGYSNQPKKRTFSLRNLNLDAFFF